MGDGANDLAMIGAPGLGVAYHAKPVVAAAAGAAIDHNDLTALLYLQGYSGRRDRSSRDPKSLKACHRLRTCGASQRLGTGTPVHRPTGCSYLGSLPLAAVSLALAGIDK